MKYNKRKIETNNLWLCRFAWRFNNEALVFQRTVEARTENSARMSANYELDQVIYGPISKRPASWPDKIDRSMLRLDVEKL